MEQEGRGKRSANQLQGAPVQDQAVRPVTTEQPRILKSQGKSQVAEELSEPYRVVVRYESHAIRGLAESRELGSIEQLLRNEPIYPLDSIRLKLLDTDTIEDVPTRDAKAVFFVKTFDGDLRHRALHFHEHAPIVPGLWVRVYFYDGEMIEGIISNTRDFVLESGFFLRPTDPNGNNALVYVLKGGLKDFHVLGMRNVPKSSN
ncbi:DUF6982 domain-containing protein [Tunturiibacter gelidoferens]|uniref:Uncharacterized protein n=1 Tax=Tunturiibacter gelidiferens TaxID=3069689 RepID=A0A9X0QG70_9BACT|nr:hypothetical protein [Edaphobacter lichenicola]MBB5329639.1 hypothetical protein [Edaphobacter lichenicola]